MIDFTNPDNFVQDALRAQRRSRLPLRGDPDSLPPDTPEPDPFDKIDPDKRGLARALMTPNASEEKLGAEISKRAVTRGNAAVQSHADKLDGVLPEYRSLARGLLYTGGAKPPAKTFGGAFKTDITEKLPIVGSVAAGFNAYDLLDRAKKLERGEATDEDIQYLADLYEKNIADEGYGAKVGAILSELPGTMVDFMVTGGLAKSVLGKGAQTVAGKALVGAVERSAAKAGATAAAKAVEKATARMVSRGILKAAPLEAAVGAAKYAQAGAPRLVEPGIKLAAGALTKSALQTALLSGRAVQSGVERDIGGKLAIGQDELGRAQVAVNESIGSLWEVLPEGMIDTWIENLSERAGPAINAIPPMDRLGLLSVRIMEKIAGETGKPLVDVIARVGRDAGIHGWASEIGEERFGQVLRAAVLGDPLELSGEQLAAEATAFAVPGLAGAATARVFGGKPKGPIDLTGKAGSFADQDNPSGKPGEGVAQEKPDSRGFSPQAQQGDTEAVEVELHEEDAKEWAKAQKAGAPKNARLQAPRTDDQRAAAELLRGAGLRPYVVARAPVQADTAAVVDEAQGGAAARATEPDDSGFQGVQFGNAVFLSDDLPQGGAVRWVTNHELVHVLEKRQGREQFFRGLSDALEHFPELKGRAYDAFLDAEATAAAGPEATDEQWLGAAAKVAGDKALVRSEVPAYAVELMGDLIDAAAKNPKAAVEAVRADPGFWKSLLDAVYRVVNRFGARIDLHAHKVARDWVRANSNMPWHQESNDPQTLAAFALKAAEALGSLQVPEAERPAAPRAKAKKATLALPAVASPANARAPVVEAAAAAEETAKAKRLAARARRRTAAAEKREGRVAKGVGKNKGVDAPAERAALPERVETPADRRMRGRTPRPERADAANPPEEIRVPGEGTHPLEQVPLSKLREMRDAEAQHEANFTRPVLERAGWAPERIKRYLNLRKLGRDPRRVRTVGEESAGEERALAGELSEKMRRALPKAIRDELLRTESGFSVDEIDGAIAAREADADVQSAQRPDDGRAERKRREIGAQPRFSRAAKGMVRLYRAEPKPGGKRNVPAWMEDSPEYQRTKNAGGRWFTDDRAEAQWYLDNEYPGGRIVSVDVPAEEAERYRVSNMRAEPNAAENPRRFSRRPEKEFFLPREHASKATDDAPRFSRAVTRTAAFRRWFGDSKVVDADGNPLVVYHGTAREFTRFEMRHAGSSRGSADERAFFFTSVRDEGTSNAEIAAADGGAAQVLPVYLRLVNPYVSKLTSYNSAKFAEEIRKAKAAGHDGITFPNVNYESERGTFAVFSPEQIKSAIGNRGTFDPAHPDIRFSRAVPRRPVVDGFGVRLAERDVSFIERLRQDVDSAYESGDTERADKLNAKLAEIEERWGTFIEAVGEEAQDFTEADERDLADLMAQGYAMRRSGRLLTDEDLIGNLRSTVETAGFKLGLREVTDEQLLDAARDAYEARRKFIDRKGAEQPRFSRAKPPEHPRVSTTGKYRGSPDITTPEQLAAFRRNLARRTMRGVSGRFWYEKSGQAILDFMGGDERLADKFIQLIAIFSPQTDVNANLGHAIRAWYQWVAGVPIRAGTYPTMMGKKATDVLYNDKDWSGRKTNNFWANIMHVVDPSISQKSTVDMWVMRALGYGKDSVTEAQYDFIEQEFEYLAQKLGDNWKAHQVQAAIWVEEKARQEKLNVNEVGQQDFSYFIKRTIGQISWESIPGKTSGHMPEMFQASNGERLAHLERTRAVLEDGAGRNLVFKEFGLLHPGTVTVVGAFEGKTNPGAQSLFAAVKVGGADKMKSAGQIEHVGKLSATDLEVLDAAVATLGRLLRQDAMAYHRPFFDAHIPKKYKNGVDLDIGRPLTEDETVALYDEMRRLSGGGDFAPIGTSTGARLLNGPWTGVSNTDFHGYALKAAENAFPASIATYFASDGNYISNDWKEKPNGEGYLEGSWAGRPDLRRKHDRLLAQLAPEIDRVDEEFARQLGWTRAARPEYSAERSEEDGAAQEVGQPRVAHALRAPSLTGLSVGEVNDERTAPDVRRPAFSRALRSDSRIARLLRGEPVAFAGKDSIGTLVRGYVEDKIPGFDLRGKTVRSSREAAELSALLRSPFTERMWWIHASPTGEVLSSGVHSIGTVNAARVIGTKPEDTERQVADMLSGGTGGTLYMAHNHPSGSPAPSPQDIAVWKRIYNEALKRGVNTVGLVLNGNRFSAIHGPYGSAMLNKYDPPKKYEPDDRGAPVTGAESAALWLKRIAVPPGFWTSLVLDNSGNLRGVRIDTKPVDVKTIRRMGGLYTVVAAPDGVEPGEAYRELIADPKRRGTVFDVIGWRGDVPLSGRAMAQGDSALLGTNWSLLEEPGQPALAPSDEKIRETRFSRARRRTRAEVARIVAPVKEAAGRAFNEGEETEVGSFPVPIASTSESPVHRALQRGVREHLYADHEVRHAIDAQAEAESALHKDPRGTTKRVVEKARSGHALADWERQALDIIQQEASTRWQRTGTNTDLLRAMELNGLLQQSGTVLSRALSTLRDANMTAADKVLRIITTPGASVRRQIKKLQTARMSLKTSDPRLERLQSRLDKLLAQEVARTQAALKLAKQSGLDPVYVTDDYFGDPSVLARFASRVGTAKSSRWDWLIELRIADMLSGPSTQVANITGNAVHIGFDQVARRFAEAVANTVVGDKNSPTFRENMEFARALPAALANAGRNFIQAYITETPIYEVDLAARGANVDDPSARDGIGPKIPGWIGRALRLPSLTTLLAFDEFFKTLSSEMELRALGYRAAKESGISHPTSADIDDAIRENIGTLGEQSLTVAKRALFQERSDVVDSILRVRRTVDEKLGVPVVSFLLPFISTPTQIFMRALEVPFSIPLALSRVVRGKYFGDKRLAVKDSAQVAMSLGIGFAVMQLIGGDDDGPWITGSRSSNYSEADLQARTAPPLSIRIGGKWYTYARVEPFATILATLVDEVNAVNTAMSREDAGVTDGSLAAAGTLFASVWNQAADKTFLRTLGDLMKMKDDIARAKDRGEAPGKITARIARDMVTPLVPFSSLVKQVSGADEPEVRSSTLRKTDERGVWEATVDSVWPGIMQTDTNKPPPKFDLWGRPIKKDGRSYLGRLVGVLKESGSPADVMDLDRLIVRWNDRVESGEVTGEGVKLFYPGQPSYSYTDKKVAYQWNDADYAALCERAGKLAAERLAGRTLNYETPGVKDIETIRETISSARDSVKRQLLREARQ